MKKYILIASMALVMALPVQAQTLTVPTNVFPPEQQALIDQIIALIIELQRQLQIQLAIEAQEKLDAKDLKTQCDELSAERDEIQPQIDALNAKHSEDVRQYYLSGNPFDYQYLPNLNSEYNLKLTSLQSQEMELIKERNALDCN